METNEVIDMLKDSPVSVRMAYILSKHTAGNSTTKRLAESLMEKYLTLSTDLLTPGSLESDSPTPFNPMSFEQMQRMLSQKDKAFFEVLAAARVLSGNIHKHYESKDETGIKMAIDVIEKYGPSAEWESQ